MDHHLKHIILWIIILKSSQMAENTNLIRSPQCAGYCLRGVAGHLAPPHLQGLMSSLKLLSQCRSCVILCEKFNNSFL